MTITWRANQCYPTGNVSKQQSDKCFTNGYRGNQWDSYPRKPSVERWACITSWDNYRNYDSTDGWYTIYDKVYITSERLGLCNEYLPISGIELCIKYFQKYIQLILKIKRKMLHHNCVALWMELIKLRHLIQMTQVNDLISALVIWIYALFQIVGNMVVLTSLLLKRSVRSPSNTIIGKKLILFYNFKFMWIPNIYQYITRWVLYLNYNDSIRLEWHTGSGLWCLFVWSLVR